MQDGDTLAKMRFNSCNLVFKIIAGTPSQNSKQNGSMVTTYMPRLSKLLLSTERNHLVCWVDNNNILRFTRCARLNTIIKMLRTELYTLTLSKG